MEEGYFTLPTYDLEDTQWSIDNNGSPSVQADVPSDLNFVEEDIISSTPKSVLLSSEPDKDISYSELYGNGLNESKLKSENEDLYSDLIIIEEERKKAELNREADYKRIKKEIEELKKKTEEKDKKLKELSIENEKLKKNMCSLYKTFKAEIERKDWLAKQKENNLYRWGGKNCSYCKKKCSFCNTADGKPCKRRRSQSPESNNEMKSVTKVINTNNTSLPQDKQEIVAEKAKNVSEKGENYKVQKCDTHEVPKNDICELQNNGSVELEKRESPILQLEEGEIEKSDSNSFDKGDTNKLQENRVELHGVDKSVEKVSLDFSDEFNKLVPESVKMSFLELEQNRLDQIRLINTIKESFLKAYDSSHINVQSPTLDSTCKEPSTSKKSPSDNRSQSSSVISKPVHVTNSHRKNRDTLSEHFDDSNNDHHSRSNRNRKPMQRDNRTMSRYRKPREQHWNRRYGFYKR